MTETEEINPTQIAFLAYQIRQCEIIRNVEKNSTKKQAMTLRIHTLKQELDPLLMGFAEQEKKRQAPGTPQMTVDRDDTNKDLGPPEAIETMHSYAKMLITRQDVVTSLASGPVSVAGEFNGSLYVIHVQRNQ